MYIFNAKKNYIRTFRTTIASRIEHLSTRMCGMFLFIRLEYRDMIPLFHAQVGK